CGFAVDRGPAGLPASRLAAIDVAVARLSEWLATSGCTSLVVAAYADAGAYTPRISLDVPVAPVRSNCIASSDSVKVDTKHAPLVMFGGYDERLRKQARDKCLVCQAKADTAYIVAGSQFLRSVRTAVSQEQVPPPLASNIAG